MTTKTAYMQTEKARFVQNHCDEFGCQFIEMIVDGSVMSKVTVTGDEENVKRLFDEIGE